MVSLGKPVPQHALVVKKFLRALGLFYTFYVNGLSVSDIKLIQKLAFFAEKKKHLNSSCECSRCQYDIYTSG
jgi:hypothetical protein